MGKKYYLLITLFIILLCGYFTLENNKITTYTGYYEIKLAASQLTSKCFEEIKKYKTQNNIPMNTSFDVNETGIIGQDYSEITTTIGNLESKRTSVNPNMSAIVVDMLNELLLNPKDKIAINFSGSFPALNIATLCAIEKLRLEPIIISSVGASTHGANDPEFTYLDMENYLYDLNLISNRSSYFSMGGIQDIGKTMNSEVKENLIDRFQSYGYELIYDDDLIHNINTRFELYNNAGEIKCFINIGGNDVSFGDRNLGDGNLVAYVDGGIITNLPKRDNSTGLVQLFLKDNKPVIHILNIKNIATKYGLPVDPIPLPAAGEGDLYYIYKYNKVLAVVLIIISSAILCIFYYVSKAKSIPTPNKMKMFRTK